jgi:purine-binding chemotaxis protein CheW
MGLVVDEVSEVRDINSEQIAPAPAFGAQVDTRFILGIGKLEESVVLLLDIDTVLSEDELLALDQAAG